MPDGYWIKDNIWQAMRRWDQESKDGGKVNLQFIGPPSSGKTTLGLKFAELMDRPVFQMNVPTITEPLDWIVQPDLTSGNLERKATAFAQAIRTPRAVCLLDECSWLTDERLLAPLFAITDSRRATYIQGLGQVSVAQDVVFWSSANVGASFQGAQTLNPAWRSRFRMVKLEIPPRKVVAIILQRMVANLDAPTATLFAEILHTAREESAETPVDLRQVIAAAQDIAYGAMFDDAIEMTFGHAFDDGETGDNRESIRRIVDSCRGRTGG